VRILLNSTALDYAIEIYSLLGITTPKKYQDIAITLLLQYAQLKYEVILHHNVDSAGDCCEILSCGLMVGDLNDAGAIERN
jgi:hypothetical protein